MRTYQDRLALTRSVLGTRIRIRLYQTQGDDFNRWMKEDMPAELYSTVSCVFADQFEGYMVPETEKKHKAFAGRISAHITTCASNHYDISRLLDSVEAFVAADLQNMHIWCRDIADTMYSQVDTDNYTFVW